MVKLGKDVEIMIRMFGMCFNWKVIAVLGVVAVGLFVLVSPATALRALPFLATAVCPLSMVLMMGAMGKTKKPSSNPTQPLPSTNRDLEIESLRARLELLEKTDGVLS